MGSRFFKNAGYRAKSSNNQSSLLTQVTVVSGCHLFVPNLRSQVSARGPKLELEPGDNANCYSSTGWHSTGTAMASYWAAGLHLHLRKEFTIACLTLMRWP